LRPAREIAIEELMQSLSQPHIARIAERSRNVERAFAIFRISLGFHIFMHGFSRVFTRVAAFVALTENHSSKP
jgi:hypothetical protein